MWNYGVLRSVTFLKAKNFLESAKAKFQKTLSPKVHNKFVKLIILTWQMHAHSQQQKHYINAIDKFKINNKDTRAKRKPCFAQLKFTCSKSIIETLEKSVKYVQSLYQNCQNDSINVLLTYFTPFTPFSIVSVVNFEQVNFSWVVSLLLTGYTFSIPGIIPISMLLKIILLSRFF